MVSVSPTAQIQYDVIADEDGAPEWRALMQELEENRQRLRESYDRRRIADARPWLQHFLGVELSDKDVEETLDSLTEGDTFEELSDNKPDPTTEKGLKKCLKPFVEYNLLLRAPKKDTDFKNFELHMKRSRELFPFYTEKDRENVKSLVIENAEDFKKEISQFFHTELIDEALQVNYATIIIEAHGNFKEIAGEKKAYIAARTGRVFLDELNQTIISEFDQACQVNPYLKWLNIVYACCHGHLQNPIPETHIRVDTLATSEYPKPKYLKGKLYKLEQHHKDLGKERKAAAASSSSQVEAPTAQPMEIGD